MSFTQKIVAPTDFSQASALALDAASLPGQASSAPRSPAAHVYDPTLLSPLFIVPGAPTLSAPVQEPRAYEESVLLELQRCAASGCPKPPRSSSRSSSTPARRRGSSSMRGSRPRI